MRFRKYENFHGDVWKYPPPLNIGPGQVGVFLHVQTSGALKGSKGYVGYQTKDPDGKDVMVSLGFDTGISRSSRRRVHTEFSESMRREAIAAMDETFTRIKENDVEIAAIIGQNYCPVCSFVIILLLLELAQYSLIVL